MLLFVCHCRGLYLGYLKARSTVASMKVICSREYPNVLPHHKIRENPNISQYVGEREREREREREIGLAG